MRRNILLLAMLALPLFGAEFKSPKECVVGMKVADRQNNTGKIIAVETTICRVMVDRTGKSNAYLFWMLHPAGASVETDDKLVMGAYNCWVGSNPTAGMRITGPTSYETDGKTGTFRLEPSREIVFTSGPYTVYHGKLLAGPKIGMNMNGGNFYNMTCDPAR